MKAATLATVALLLSATDARADLVWLTSGRTMSVAAIRFDGDRAVLTLRSGGDIECDRALIATVTPDEVPYADTSPSAAATAAAEAPGTPSSSERFVPGRNAPSATPGPYDALIRAASSRHGVDARVVRAVIQVESGYHHRARSARGALGLMQLMPTTARQYEVRRPFDPAANIDAGTRHLRQLLARFPLPVALAAYNAGEATVTRYQGIPPYPETRDYVRRVLQLIATSAEKP
ncbi:MAG: lytic transglycosylase domain-containing protein [Vicinamibacterales bacterium]